jgi:trehalose 6-phosphate phosphatase
MMVVSLPLRFDEVALFLDFDGTLVEFVTDPSAPRVDPALGPLLATLHGRLGGALAIVSGRPIAELDRLLHPLRVPAAGVHGLERRDAAGRLYRGESAPGLDAARELLSRAVAGQQGLLIEDKGSSLAIHCRGAPGALAAVDELADQALAVLGAAFERLDGDLVVELKPASCNKGSAVAGFMRESPFVERVPVCVGDDLTDADAFATARRHGGLGVAVGDRIAGEHRLESPGAVRDWLRRLAASPHFAR